MLSEDTNMTEAQRILGQIDEAGIFKGAVDAAKDLGNVMLGRKMDYNTIPTFYDSTKKDVSGVFDINSPSVKKFLRDCFVKGSQIINSSESRSVFGSSVSALLKDKQTFKSYLKRLKKWDELKRSAEDFVKREAPDAGLFSGRAKLIEGALDAAVEKTLDGAKTFLGNQSGSSTYGKFKTSYETKFAPPLNRILASIEDFINKGGDIGSNSIKITQALTNLTNARKFLFGAEDFLYRVTQGNTPEATSEDTKELLDSIADFSNRIDDILEKREEAVKSAESSGDELSHQRELEKIHAKNQGKLDVDKFNNLHKESEKAKDRLHKIELELVKANNKETELKLKNALQKEYVSHIRELDSAIAKERDAGNFDRQKQLLAIKNDYDKKAKEIEHEHNMDLTNFRAELDSQARQEKADIDKELTTLRAQLALASQDSKFQQSKALKEMDSAFKATQTALAHVRGLEVSDITHEQKLELQKAANLAKESLLVLQSELKAAEAAKDREHAERLKQIEKEAKEFLAEINKDFKLETMTHKAELDSQARQEKASIDSKSKKNEALPKRTETIGKSLKILDDFIKGSDWTDDDIDKAKEHLEVISQNIKELKSQIPYDTTLDLSKTLGLKNASMTLHTLENGIKRRKTLINNAIRSKTIQEVEPKLDKIHNSFLKIKDWAAKNDASSIKAPTMRKKINALDKLSAELNDEVANKIQNAKIIKGDVFNKVQNIRGHIEHLRKSLADNYKKLTLKKTKSENMVSKLLRYAKIAEAMGDPNMPPATDLAQQQDPIPPEPIGMDTQVPAEPIQTQTQAVSLDAPQADPQDPTAVDTVSAEFQQAEEQPDKSDGGLSTRKVMTAVKKAVNSEIKQMAKNISRASKWPDRAAKKAIEITTDKSTKDILTKVKNNLKEDMNEKLQSIINECAILEKKLAKSKAKEKAKKAKEPKKEKAKAKVKDKKTKAKKSVKESVGSMAKFFAASKVTVEAKKSGDVGKYFFKKRSQKKTK